MATPRGRPDPPLSEELFEAPYRFDFFQAVRLLERLSPGSVPVGRVGPKKREAVTFRVHQSLAFPPSSIQALTPGDETGSPPEMTVAFLGLTGPVGVLPHCYTELLIARSRAGDRTAAAFFDVFNHRLISLFFRAWEKYRPYLAHERGEGDRASTHLFDLIGLGMEPLRNRSLVPDEAFRFYAGFFARRHRPAILLSRLLNDYFGLPVEVQSFVGQWLPLSADDRSRLGASGAHNGLGTTLVLGRRVWDEQSKFRLRLGPLTLDRYLALSPDETEFRAIVQMTRMYVDAEFEFDLQLVLAAEEVPSCVLSPNPRTGPRLGRTAWLKSRPFVKDAEDAIYPSGE